MHHFRKTRKQYKTANARDSKSPKFCGLCDAIARDSDLIIYQNETMVVIRNRVAYDMFEGLRTTGEHYMVIPKRHRVMLTEFDDQEQRDMFSMIAQYEAQGFSVYARSIENINRSQEHQHTHLIQTSNKKTRAIVYVNRPHVLRVI